MNLWSPKGIHTTAITQRPLQCAACDELLCFFVIHRHSFLLNYTSVLTSYITQLLCYPAPLCSLLGYTAGVVTIVHSNAKLAAFVFVNCAFVFCISYLVFLSHYTTLHYTALYTLHCKLMAFFIWVEKALRAACQ